MHVFRKIGLMAFLVVMMKVSLLSLSAGPVGSDDFGFSTNAEPRNTSEIVSPFDHVVHAIEQTNSFHTFTEVHRLLSVFMVYDREIPLNHNFRSTIFIPVSVNIRTLVPIFIRGHALLN